MEYITNVLITSAEESIPLKSNHPKRPPIPWWCDELTKLKREKNAAERARKRNHNPATHLAYKRCKAKMRYFCNKYRKESWQSFLSSINQNTTLHTIWKKVKSIAGKFRASPPPAVKNNVGELATDGFQVANILAEHISNVSNDINYPQTFLRYKRIIESTPVNFNNNQNTPYNVPITKREFNHALSTTKESSPGSDRITYLMIKKTNPTIQELILSTFNKIFIENTFPKIWQTAIIIPIPKSGKDPTIAENYRPISLTNCLCKLMEKIINTRLMWFLELNDLISGHVRI